VPKSTARAAQSRYLERSRILRASPAHFLVTGAFFSLDRHDEATMTLGASKLDLVPVALAARMLYQRAYGMPPPQLHLAERLNSLAYTLASRGSLYAIEEGKSAPRRLRRDELACGYFRHGGEELHFLDERVPILQLAVNRDSIESAVEDLRGNWTSLK